MSVINLHNEDQLVESLVEDTLGLIHCTTRIKPIKLLVSAHDILSLTLMLEKQVAGEQPKAKVWDRSVLKDLGQIRLELMLKHRLEFRPLSNFDSYTANIGTMIRISGLHHLPQ